MNYTPYVSIEAKGEIYDRVPTKNGMQQLEKHLNYVTSIQKESECNETIWECIYSKVPFYGYRYLKTNPSLHV